MAYDAKLAERVRVALGDLPEVREISMMGGLCFTHRGNMCCGVLKDDVVLRVSPGHYEALLTKPGARPMDFTGRPMRGFLFVGPKGQGRLDSWLKLAVEFVKTLPPKKKKSRSRR